MKWCKLYLLVILAAFAGCSSTSTVYESDHPLTKRSVKSSTTDLRVYIPQGWFYTTADQDNFIDIWLIRDDYSASITFLPVHFENEGAAGNYALQTVFEFVKIKTESGGNLISNPKDTLVLNSKSLLTFEYTNTKEELSRVAVFSHKGVFYQCTAFVLNSDADPSEVFAVQNSVLKSVFSLK